ncbi:MAG TPA: hypothetical protein VMU39_00895 [Solirubrobacteraceae bacterium]|nr:hypothetical protein [Solirubrobacteraceae bacterium]
MGLSEDQLHRTRAAFAAHGHTDPLRVAPISGEDERIFVLSPGAPLADEGKLVCELQDILHRKVWIVRASAAWPDSQPLA